MSEHAAKNPVSVVVNAAALNTKVLSENLTNSLSTLGNHNLLKEDSRYFNILNCSQATIFGACFLCIQVSFGN